MSTFIVFAIFLDRSVNNDSYKVPHCLPRPTWRFRLLLSDYGVNCMRCVVCRCWLCLRWRYCWWCLGCWHSSRVSGVWWCVVSLKDSVPRHPQRLP